MYMKFRPFILLFLIYLLLDWELSPDLLWLKKQIKKGNRVKDNFLHIENLSEMITEPPVLKSIEIIFVHGNIIVNSHCALIDVKAFIGVALVH